MTTTRAFGAFDAKSPLGPLDIERRTPTVRDVAFDILYCGVCHSDLHTARGEWDHTTYPCVPGHEIIGRVTSVGAKVTRFRPGDVVAAGVMVDSCRHCAACNAGYEQFCDNSEVSWTYNSPDKHLPGKMTYGGYSSRIVVDEHFCFTIPKNLDLAKAAPLLCAGITTYSPLTHWNAGPGRRVGIVGLGGLGHMGVKLSHALGAETTVFTTSKSKLDDAKRLGADEAVLSTDAVPMKKREKSLDLIVDTVAASHDLNDYLSLLRRDGVLVLVGIPEHDHPAPSVLRLLSRRRSLAASAIGGIPETQEMLDFCGAHNITADVEVIPVQRINEAYERMLRGDVKYRFVIDAGTLG